MSRPRRSRCGSSGQRPCSTTASTSRSGRTRRGLDGATTLTLAGEPVDFDERDMLADELAEFGRCIHGKTEPETGADEGIAALAAVLQALEAQAEAITWRCWRPWSTRSARLRSPRRSMSPCATTAARWWRSGRRHSTRWRSVSQRPAIRGGRSHPLVPGLEGAGTVVESARLPPGTRVRFESPALPGFGAQGTLAERAAVPEESLVELPGRGRRRRRGGARSCRHHRAARA